jgi:SAM-dependent methyltransferase
VLDIGAVCGATTLLLADRVGTYGSVLGLDLSEPMLDVAARRAAEAGLGNVTTLVADAQHHRPDDQAHLVASRFGVMFFADPVAAFANLRASLVPGGRLAFVCWQAVQLNPWAIVPGRAIASVVGPAAPADPLAPGPFAFAAADRVRSVLTEAGWSDIDVSPIGHDLFMGVDVDEAAHLAIQVGPAARMLAEVSADTRRRALEMLRNAIAEQAAADGSIRMGSACWRVTARRS